MKLLPFLLPFLISAVLPGSLAAQTTTTFVPLSSTWKYLDNGSNQGTAWRAAGFSDSTWAQGPAELGYGDGGEATVVSYGPSSSSKYITTYFRKSFTVTNAAAYTTAALRVRRDDGVIIYLNGTEVYRNNLPTGTISYTTLAPSAIGGADESALQTSTVNPALLVEGTNVLAVEMHQNAANSSDLSFDMDFAGTMPGNTPTANAQSVTVTENTTKDITLTGSDPNGDPITFAILAEPTKGVLSGAAPNLTYTPNPNATGADSFTFTVSDGTNTSAAATVSLTIVDVNDPPVADAQSVTLAEEGSADIVLNGSDAESVYGMLPNYTQQLYNGNLSAITDGLSGATWNANTGTLFLIRNVSTGGGHSYEYTADGTHLRTITQSGFQDTEAIAWMYGDTYAIAEENNNQRISIVTIAPGATTLERTAAGNVTWTTPVGSLLNLGIESLCYDAGRDVLYYLCEKPAGGSWPIYTMNPQTGVTTVLCDLNATVFTSGVATDFSDMAHDRATDTFVILSHESNKIVRVDRAGAVVEQRGFTTALTQAEMIALTPDRLRLFIGGEPKQFAHYALPADTLTYNLVTPPAHGSLSGLPPRLTYTPVPNFSGTDSFTFRMWDGTVYSPEATVTLNVTPANDPPAGGGISTTAEETEPTLVVLPVSDPDGDELTIQTTQPVHGTLSMDGTMATYTANTGYIGPDSFTYTVSDGEFTVGPFTVNITVVQFNAAPVSSDGSASLDEDTPAPVTLVATDAENDPLTWNIVTPPGNGTISGTAPNLTYTPALNFHGSDSFTWSASDATKTSAPATFSITVSPVNDAPAAQSFAVFTETNTPATVALAGSDVENAPLTFTVSSPPASGTLSGTPPALTYMPDADYTGADSFSYTANDGALDSAPATVNITVTAPVLDNLVSSGAVWKYLANGSNQGSAWRDASFDDTAWPQGPAQLGYGDGDEATLVPFGPDSNNKYITTYFRHEFQVPNPGALSGPLQLELLRDDGAVVYLNGTEVFRSNMPAGSIAWNTLASTAVADANEDAFFSTTLQAGLILPGRNVLAVELHQSSASSSDLSFDLKLYETLPAITRGPYVQMTGTDRATVRWRTNVAVSSVLNYGTVEGALASSVTGASPVMEHEIHVTGLDPDTRYYYSAGSPQGAFVSGADYSFSTHPAPDTTRPYRFWVLGDAGTGTVNQTSVRDAFYAWNGTTRVDGVLLLGDNVYETGTDAEYQTKFFEIYPTVLRNTTFWPAFGNHDSGSASSSTQTGPYYDSFTMPKFGEAGGLATGTEAYYSFDYGNIHFVCLDSEGSSLSGSGAMAQWLQADLAATQREWIIAYWHHPPYSKGSHDSDNATTDSGKMKNMREIFLPILESFGVDLLLFGHEHAYFRSKFVDGHYGISTTFNEATMLKQAGMGDPAVDGPYVKVDGPNNGAVYTVAGSSGKLNSYTRSMPVLALALNELGSVVLDVNGRELTSRFLNNSGVVRDTFAIVHNAPPVAGVSVLTGAEDAPLAVTLAGTDADGDALTYEILAPPAVGSLSGSAPALTWTPPADFSGTATLEYRVNDGRVNSDPAIITLNITPVNDAPLAAAQSLSGTEDGIVAVTLTGSDADGDALTFTIITPPAQGILSGTAPELTFTPAPDWHGTDSFEFIANDGSVASAPAVCTITVTPVNDLPVAAPQSLVTDEDTALPVLLAATDADGDALTFSITTPPDNGAISGTAPNLLYTPAANFHGTDSFTFSASDASSASAPVVVSIAVAAVDDAPLAAAQSLATEEDSVLPVTLTGTDADGDALSFTVTISPAHGILSGTAPDLIYTPDADWNGADSLAFTVSDGAVTSAPAVIAITVTAVNDAPLASPGAFTTDEDTALPVTLVGTDADGDALAFTVTVPPAHGTLSGTPPNLTYTPGENFHGADSFEFTTSDGQATSAAAVASFTVTSINDAPLAAAGSVTTDEDSPAPVTLTGSDPDGDALTFSVTTLPAHGTLSGTAPELLYTPGANWHGADFFEFTANDGTVASAPAVFTITVAPVNDLPVATPQSLATDEDTPVNVTLTGTDSDGDGLDAIVLSQPAHGILSGTLPDLTYTPDADWNGSDSFTFAVTDGPAVSEPVAVTITVAPVDDRPVASAQSLTGAEDGTVAVTLAATDADGDALTYAVTLQPAHGTLSGTAPDLIYTPDPGWHGLDSFSFTASDAAETSLPAAVTIEITPVNDAPVALAASLVTEEDTALPIFLTGSDDDGDALTFTVTVPPAHGTLLGTAPNLTYTPDTDWNGSDTFTFTASDGVATSAAALVEIGIVPVNDAPLANTGSTGTSENTPAAITLTGSDADGDALTFTITTPPVHGILSGTAPDLVYTPETDWHGTDTLEFIVNDGSVASAPAVFTITVTLVNNLPVAAPQSLATDEDTALPVLLTATDADGDALTFSITTPPANGAISGTAPDLLYTPAANFHGTDSFTFTASDAAGSSAPVFVSITIAAVNDAPVAAAQSLVTGEDSSLPVTLTGSDADGDALTFTVTISPAHGILSGNAPDLIYTPDADWNGTDSVEFAVQDTMGASLPATITITVTPANDPPVPAAQSLATDEDTALPLVIAATDIDGDALTFAITSPPAHGTLSGTAPDLIYTPNADWNGSDSFIFTASDGTEVGSATISIEVTPMNDAPVAGSAAVSTMEDTALPVQITATDAEGDALTFVITALPAHGSLSGSAPNLIYTPNANYNGSDEFTFTASDASGAGAPAAVSITITSVNDVPAATALVLETAEDTAGGVALSGTDIEGDLLGFVITALPAHGSLSGTAPDLIYTPDADWNGTDSFAYTVTDGPAVSEPATVSLTVTPVNDRPVATPQSLSTSEDTPVAVILAAVDVDGDALTFAVTLQPAHGTLSGTAPNLSYTPEPGWEGVDSFSFTASDAVETSLAAAITMETNPVNDPPVAVAQSLSATEDTALALTLSGTDGDGDPLSFTVTAPPAQGTLSGTAPNLIYMPAPDFAGTDSLEFAVSDGAFTSAPAVITITVEPVNDPPVAQAQSLTMDEDAALPITLLASDVENDVLAFAVSVLPQHGTLSGTAPNLTYTPESNFHGADSFEFTVSDGAAQPVSAVVSIAITPVNDAPAPTPQALATDEDAALAIVLAGSDADGDTLTFSITVPPAQGSLSGTAPSLTYTPNADWHGSDRFEFTVSDGTITSPAASVGLTVRPVNDAPVAADQSLATDAMTAVPVTLGATDIDGDALTFSIETPPAHGTLSGEAPALTYTPDPAWSGVDTLTFTASDGSAVSAPATVTVTIAPASPWQLVVSTGQVVPGVGGAAVGTINSDYVSDAAGRASFSGTAGGVTGIWTEGDAGLEAVMVQGGSAAGVSGAVWDSVTVGPWAAGDGELLLYGRMTPGTGGVTNSSDYAYWHRNGGNPAIIAREGTAPPSMPAAAQFSTLSTVATLEAGGNYAFAATMTTNSSLGITSANDTGLWGTFGAEPRLMIRENDSAPGAGTGVFDAFTSAALASNSSGQLAFSTAMKVAGSISSANRFGLWLWDPFQFGLVARGGDPAPGAGVNFAQPDQPSLGGALAFRSTLATGKGGASNSSDTGIWILESGIVSLVAREGSQAPGIAAGGIFNNMADAAVMNSEGDYTFRAALRNGGGVSSSNNAGIWTRSAATGGILTIVARKGDIAPGAGAGTWSSFEVPLIANDGSEAFTATLTQSSVAGVNSSNDRGLWVRSSDGSLVLALRAGDAFAAGPADTRTVSAITLPGAQSSGRTPFSDDGRLLVLVGFTDGSTALCRYTLP